jgi:hypothetical protein
VLRQDGSRGRWVRFWASARRRACEVLQKERNEVRPGIDFALTEIVHCKSRNEIGVSEAREFCSDRYLQRILCVSAARVLIVFGDHAREAVWRYLKLSFGISEQGVLTEPVIIENISRIFVFLPHPNARGPKKTLKDNLETGLDLLRDHVKGISKK